MSIYKAFKLNFETRYFVVKAFKFALLKTPKHETIGIYFCLLTNRREHSILQTKQYTSYTLQMWPNHTLLTTYNRRLTGQSPDLRMCIPERQAQEMEEGRTAAVLWGTEKRRILRRRAWPDWWAATHRLLQEIDCSWRRAWRLCYDIVVSCC